MKLIFGAIIKLPAQQQGRQQALLHCPSMLGLMLPQQQAVQWPLLPA